MLSLKCVLKHSIILSAPAEQSTTIESAILSVEMMLLMAFHTFPFLQRIVGSF